MSVLKDFDRIMRQKPHPMDFGIPCSARVKLSILLVFFSWLRTTTAITCFSYDGNLYDDQQLCPGSQQCCGVNATCKSNRLCHNNGDADGTFVRGPCALRMWDTSVCATVCLYSEEPNGGIFPRVTQCADGSWCCNNDISCCTSHHGTFLDAQGKVVTAQSLAQTTHPGLASASPPASSLSSVSLPISSSLDNSSASSGSASSSQPTFSSSSLPAAASPGSSSSSLSSGVKAGIGVGVSLGSIALAALGFGLWRLRAQRNKIFRSPMAVEMDVPMMGGPKYKHQMDLGALGSETVPSEALIELLGEMLEAQELPTTN